MRQILRRIHDAVLQQIQNKEARDTLDNNVVKEFKSNAILQLMKAKRTFLKRTLSNSISLSSLEVDDAAATSPRSPGSDTPHADTRTASPHPRGEDTDGGGGGGGGGEESVYDGVASVFGDSLRQMSSGMLSHVEEEISYASTSKSLNQSQSSPKSHQLSHTSQRSSPRSPHSPRRPNENSTLSQKSSFSKRCGFF